MPNPAGELKGNLGRILYNNQLLVKRIYSPKPSVKIVNIFKREHKKIVSILSCFYVFLNVFYVLLTVCVVVFFSSDILLIYSAV